MMEIFITFLKITLFSYCLVIHLVLFENSKKENGNVGSGIGRSIGLGATLVAMSVLLI